MKPSDTVLSLKQLLWVRRSDTSEDPKPCPSVSTETLFLAILAQVRVTTCSHLGGHLHSTRITPMAYTEHFIVWTTILPSTGTGLTWPASMSMTGAIRSSRGCRGASGLCSDEAHRFLARSGLSPAGFHERVGCGSFDAPGIA